MKGIRYYAALLGLLTAAAVAVTACGTVKESARNSAETGNAAAGSAEAGNEAAGSTEAGSTEAGNEAAGSTEAGSAAAGSTAAGSTEAGNAAGSAAEENPKAGDDAAGAETGRNPEKDTGQAQPVTGAEPADGEVLTGIPVDTEKSGAVSIYYGSVCYSYFSEDKEKIKETADLFSGFSLEEVKDGQLDEATTYQVYFSTDTEQIAAINVDKSGMFYIPEEKKFYKIKAGTFHFEKLDKIYKDSMYKDGFDENQCLIR